MMLDEQRDEQAAVSRLVLARAFDIFTCDLRFSFLFRRKFHLQSETGSM